MDNDRPLLLRLVIDGLEVHFEWTYEDDWKPMGGIFRTDHFSDEFCGEFTGTSVGMACTDGVFRRKCADFDWFEMKDMEGCGGRQ